MYCIKCGREVADGELFCSTCSNRTDEKTPEPEETRVEREVEAQPSRKAQTPAKPVGRKKINVLLIPLIVVCLITVFALVGVLHFYEEMNITKNNYRVKEANLESQVNELETMQAQLDAASLALEAAEAANLTQQATIAELQQQITLMEGSASQGAYDAISAQQTISRLESEKEGLNEEITGLEEDNEELAESIEALTESIETLNEDIADLQETLEEKETELEEKAAALEEKDEKIETLTEDLEEASEKADFMDTYVVFVNNDDTNHYHSYDCSHFVKADFWAYSRKLAENYGYTACPICGG